MTTILNQATITTLKSVLIDRNDMYNRWGNLTGSFLALPGLRGLWSFGAVNSSGGAIDLSSNGLTLTNNNTALFSKITGKLIPIAVLDGSTQYFNRADSAAVDTLGTEGYISSTLRGMTIGGWFKFDDAPTLAAIENLIAKDDQVANNRSYVLQRLTDGQIGFVIWDSTNTLYANNDGPIISDTTDWHFIVVRVNTASQTVSIDVDGTTYNGSGGCGTDIDNSTSDFTIGASDVPNRYFDGWLSHCFLCTMDIGQSLSTALWEQGKVLYGL